MGVNKVYMYIQTQLHPFKILSGYPVADHLSCNMQAQYKIQWLSYSFCVIC